MGRSTTIKKDKELEICDRHCFGFTYTTTLVSLHQEILESLGIHASYLGGMVHQTSSWGYSNHIRYISTSFPAYLSEGPLSYCCSAIAPGSPVVVAAFTYKHAFTDHTYACIEKLISVYKTALNQIWAVSIKW